MRPTDVSPEEMIARDTIGSSPVFRIRAVLRLEIGIHPVIVPPVDRHPGPFREPYVQDGSDLSLWSIPDRKSVAVDIHFRHRKP